MNLRLTHRPCAAPAIAGEPDVAPLGDGRARQPRVDVPSVDEFGRLLVEPPLRIEPPREVTGVLAVGIVAVAGSLAPSGRCFTDAMNISSKCLNEPTLRRRVGVAVDVDREAELAGQQHGASGSVVQQNGRSVAPLVGLVLLGCLTAVSVSVVVGRAAQDMPASGKQLDVAHDDIRVAGQVPAGQVPAGLVQPGAASRVGRVQARATPRE